MYVIVYLQTVGINAKWDKVIIPFIYLNQPQLRRGDGATYKTPVMMYAKGILT